MPHVVLLHGLGADRRAFQRFERLLPDSWRIDALDLLGHGDAPKPDEGYSLEHHADHVATWLGTHAGDTRPVVVGHSYGAATAVALAARHPGLVGSIVLLDPVVTLDARAGSGTSTARMVAAKLDGTVEAAVVALFPDASPALQRWTIETWERMARGVVLELDTDWTRFAGHVDLPVTIVHGDVELGGAGDIAADWFDEPRVVRIPGAGHYLHATHARETADAVATAVGLVT